ncbi:hypothetical protein J7E96_19525 [Streptomyces sp. ISL-96]|uniref:hypothetical protein n=1 Tax=Streptomyces sp. ISL-96 TaxID=2819191 RepID=UPI001BE9DA09|nr:hypothetical protein [Streptomyces sp. ISL-96]MBT2490666.1 hypothetical protein [Streptomyces sp. ISL-96]
MEPIDTRQPGAAVSAYAGILEWPLTVGYRNRPRQGCTCQTEECRTPGAHPVPGRPNFRSVEEIQQELEASPGAGLIAWTTVFDALVVPRPLGMAAMVSLDRVAPVPCLVTEDHVVLLVLPATGRYALDDVPGEVRSGSDQWIAVPPTYGVRWDTTPWVEQTATPVQLLHGRDVGRHLREAKQAAGAEVQG